MRRFTTIKGENSPSSIRRFPRLGKIRLGYKKRTKKGMGPNCKHDKADLCPYCSYPVDTPHFVCPPEVQAVFGPEPKEIRVLLPAEDNRLIFPQYYAAYNASQKLLCQGDGAEAERYNKETKKWESRQCPCDWLDERKCGRKSSLSVMVPDVAVGGIYQIDSGAFSSIVNINSDLDFIRGIIGRVALVPLTMSRVPTKIPDEDGKMQTHYPIKLTFEGTMEDVRTLREKNQMILTHVKDYVLPEPPLPEPEPTDDLTPVEIGSRPEPETDETIGPEDYEQIRVAELLEWLHNPKLIPTEGLIAILKEAKTGGFKLDTLKTLWTNMKDHLEALPKPEKALVEKIKNEVKEALGAK